MKSFLATVQKIFAGFSKDEIFTRSAALAFYTTSSLGPLAVLAVFFLSILDLDLQDSIVAQVQGLLGTESATVFQSVLDSANKRPDLSSFSGWVGAGTLLFSASLIFAQIQATLNQIFEADKVQEQESEQSWAQMVQGLVVDRLVSIGVLLAILFISVVSLLLSSSLAYLVPTGETLWSYAINEFVSLFIFTMVFAVIFKWMPDRRLNIKDTLIGAFVTALLFEIGKFGIGLYIGHSAIGSAFGAAGSLVVLLVWVYYSSLIMFLGAEVCWVTLLANREKPETNL